MKAKLYYASDWRIMERMEISSLEDFLKLYKEKGFALIIKTESEMTESDYISDMQSSKTEYLHITVYDHSLE